MDLCHTGSPEGIQLFTAVRIPFSTGTIKLSGDVKNKKITSKND